MIDQAVPLNYTLAELLMQYKPARRTFQTERCFQTALAKLLDEEKRRFFPLGWGEVASIMCDGILRRHGSDLDEYVKNGQKKF